ncbi:MAG: hypothetical protein C0621_08115 [Desulfuromonas sp.]|nr:MAG: hypothetical protein C0621_08115 [Desulfuromonas sp.]
MPTNNILQIVTLCREIDEIAHRTYNDLSAACDDPCLRQFWETLRDEESGHIRFWRRFQELAGSIDYPDIFEHPEIIIADLQDILRRVEEHHQLRHSLANDPKGSLLLACRMEFLLLHPAIDALFQFQQHTELKASGPDEEIDYEQHVLHLLEMVRRYGEASDELDLLGESLYRLWKDNRKLATQAVTDTLTGLYNRRGFIGIATQLAYLCQRQKSPVGLLMLDIDHFKKVNDEHGHLAGDLVLQKVAHQIAATVRTSDLVGRFGGEEFVVLMPQSDLESLKKGAERIRAAVEATCTLGETITVSAGGVCAVLEGEIELGLQHLIQCADSLLYRAKNSGRNQVIAATCKERL